MTSSPPLPPPRRPADFDGATTQVIPVQSLRECAAYHKRILEQSGLCEARRA